MQRTAESPICRIRRMRKGDFVTLLPQDGGDCFGYSRSGSSRSVQDRAHIHSTLQNIHSILPRLCDLHLISLLALCIHALDLHRLPLLRDSMLRSDSDVFNIPKVRHAKQLIHALERDALGLGHEEEGDEHHEGAEGAEDEVLSSR